MKLLSDQEILEIPVGTFMVYDIETFKNFLYFGFKIVGTDRYVEFRADDKRPLDVRKLSWFINRFQLIGFYSNGFDIHVMNYALQGHSVGDVKKAADSLIIDNYRGFAFEKRFNLKPLKIQHIDLIEVCPVNGGLKAYGARLHAPKLQDIPTPPDKWLTEKEKEENARYCLNDLDLTELIMYNLKDQLGLRYQMSQQYGVDLRSKSDAQIAEAVIKSELSKALGRSVGKPPSFPADFSFQYNVQDWTRFQNPLLQQVLDDIRDTHFTLTENGAVATPKCLQNRTVRIGSGFYTLGVGGLHSNEKRQAFSEELAKKGGYILIDRDVSSYYPAIILNQGLYPKHLGPTFLDVYRSIVNRRLEAKKIKSPIADSLKIVINGSFGKLGSKYSCFYSPELFLQVTMTGQLSLLMLIEMAEARGLRVVSANTDGLVFWVKGERRKELEEVIDEWEKITAFETEETIYRALYSRDVNNYIAIKQNGEVKTNGTYKQAKGIFRFHKNPDCSIITTALVELFNKGTPVETTIRACKDIREFVTARSVTGGAWCAGEYLGKTVRWYYSRHSKRSILYGNGNKVPLSEGAMPCQTLPTEFPLDVNYEAYIDKANKALIAIGARPEPEGQIYFEIENEAS